jgi:prepilin-type N-terminal cleavage/methylation domain-containing protein
MIQPRDGTRLSDEGFTLIELLVYVSLFSIILVIVGGLMIDSLKVERDVTSAATATSTAQLVSTSVQSAVRNGSGVRVVSAGSDGSQMLIVRTTTRGAAVNWVCQAWYFSAADKAVYTRISSTPAVAIALPASSPRGVWTLLGSGITPSKPSAQSVFVATNDSAALNFEVAAGNRQPVRVETKAYTRIKTPVGAPCFS